MRGHEPLAFFLNLDAELELEAGRRYQATDATKARMHALAIAMRSSLPRGAVVFPLGDPAPRDARAIAWCPTPQVLARIDQAGLARPDAPGVEVLARVSERGFAFALSEGELPGAVRVADEETAWSALSRPGEWLLKRAFGLSGRGQRPVRGGALSEADRAFVRASLARGRALYVEPRVVIRRELSVHAWVTRRGVAPRTIREQHVDRFGAFVASARASLDRDTERALLHGAERVGLALIDAGYTGPFGVDAFEYEGPHGVALRTLSEINARYCMGWDDDDGWLPP
jgi:hypothetical protein